MLCVIGVGFVLDFGECEVYNGLYFFFGFDEFVDFGVVCLVDS